MSDNLTSEKIYVRLSATGALSIIFDTK